MNGPPSGMANVLSEEKRKQVEALGRLGWSLRRIEREAEVRRETASALPQGRGDRGARARRHQAKTGHFAGGDHRPRRSKTGHFAGGDHRLQDHDELVRAVPRAHRALARRGPDRHVHLADARRRPRVQIPLRRRPALRTRPPRNAAARGSGRDPDTAGRGGAGRLRRRADGPASDDGEISARPALHPDAGT